MALQVWLPLNKDFRNSGLKGPFVTATNVTFSTAGVSGNCASFNGSNSYISLDGAIANGTNRFSYAAWVKFNNVSATHCLYSQRTAVGEGYSIFLIGGKIRFDAGGNLWTTTATIAANTWIHFAVTYDGSVKKLYINGNLSSTNTATTTVNVGEKATIGGSSEGDGVANNNRLNGFLYDVRIYDNALTADDVKDAYNSRFLYSKPQLDGNTNFSWLRVLHHNNPKAARFASQEEGKNKDTKDHFSKLKVFFNNDVIRSRSGKYEFMAKERLESNSAEQTFMWKQTSNPTASTVSGYELVSQTTNPNRSFGLLRNGSYAVFHNGSTWWCACGSVSDFNGGIPGFGGTVLSGYLDLYVKVDNSMPPYGYTRLEYIESNGNQWIDTGVKACMNKIRCVCDMTPLNGNDTAFFGSRGTYYLFYKVSDNYFWPTSKCENISGTLVVGNKYHVDWNKGQLEVAGDDGVHQTASRSNSTQDSSNMYIFNFNPTDSRSTTAKLYYFDIYIDDVIVRKFIPCKRNSDNVVGLFDVVNNVFYASGSQNFIAGPAV